MKRLALPVIDVCDELPALAQLAEPVDGLVVILALRRYQFNKAVIMTVIS